VLGGGLTETEQRISVRYVLYVLKLQTCCMTFIAITPPRLSDHVLFHYVGPILQYLGQIPESRGVMLSSCDNPT